MPCAIPECPNQVSETINDRELCWEHAHDPVVLEVAAMATPERTTRERIRARPR